MELGHDNAAEQTTVPSAVLGRQTNPHPGVFDARGFAIQMEKLLCPISKSMMTQHGRQRVCLVWKSRSFTAGPQLLRAEQISISLQAVPSFDGLA